MVILFFIVLALTIALVVFFVIKTPKLVPKKHIVEAVLATSDELFTHKQEVRSLVGDTVNFYQGRDQLILSQRYGNIDRRAQDIERRLSSINEKLDPYEKVKSQSQFYALATTASGTMKQVTSRLAEFKNDVLTFSPVVEALQKLNVSTQDNAMTTYVSEDDTAAVERVVNHIAIIIDLANRTAEELRAAHFQSDEFRHVTDSILTAILKMQDDYKHVADLLHSKEYDQYRNVHSALPTFFARFDTNGYDTILMASFNFQSEETYINDLRIHAYTD